MLISSKSGKSVIVNDVIGQLLSTESYPVVSLDFPGTEIDNSTSETVLFDSVDAAYEVANSLQADWDSCNGVKIRDFDLEAFKVATSVLSGEWCNFGDSVLVPRDEPLSDWSQAVLAEMDRLKITFPISRAELYWAVADWRGTHSAESLSNGLGFRKSTVQGHLSALEKAGAIRSEGRPKQYTVAEDCPQEYLAQLQPLAEIARTTRCYWRCGHGITRQSNL